MSETINTYNSTNTVARRNVNISGIITDVSKLAMATIVAGGLLSGCKTMERAREITAGAGKLVETGLNTGLDITAAGADGAGKTAGVVGTTAWNGALLIGKDAPTDTYEGGIKAWDGISNWFNEYIMGDDAKDNSSIPYNGPRNNQSPRKITPTPIEPQRSNGTWYGS